MPNTISALTGNARIFLLLDDRYPTSYNQHPTKTFYKVTSYVNVSSQISVEGGGSASIVLNDKDMIWRKIFPFRYLNTREFGDELIWERGMTEKQWEDIKKTRVPITVALTNQNEINIYRKLLEHYGKKQKGINKISQFAGDDLNGGIMVPLPSPQNLVWIDYLSREGKWIRKFSGIVVSITDEQQTKATPYLTLNCRTYDRLLEYSYVVTGLKNLGGKEGQSPTEIISLSNQTATVSTVNKYYGKKFSQIVVDAFRTANTFFLRKDENTGEDYRYFKVRNIFGFGEDNVNSDGTVEQLGEEGYEIYDPIWNRAGWVDKNGVIKNRKEFNFDDPLDINRDFYPGSEVIINNKPLNAAENTDWIQVIMAKDFWNDKKPFQNLVRTSLTLFNTDKMTPKDILDEAKKIVLCYVYPDGDGSFKVERPYFDIYHNMKDYEPEELVPQDFDLRYIITKKDRSYLKHTYTENEAPLVTRVEMQSNPDFINFDSTQKALLQGFSNSSLKVISKYGERIVTLKAIPTQGFKGVGAFRDKILDSYCFAQKLLLSTKSKSFSIELDQRPDLMLNRPMMFLDNGLTGVIHTLSESYSPGGQHKTTVKWDFVRYIGFKLFNPWRKLVKKDETGKYYDADGKTPKLGWKLEDWPPIDLVDLSKSGDNPYGIGVSLKDRIGTEAERTYSSVKDIIVETDDNFDDNKVTLLIVRDKREGTEQWIDEPDDFNFIWTDGGGQNLKVLYGSAGDPKNQLQWKDKEKFAKIKQGQYRFGLDIQKTNADNQGNQLTHLPCKDFSYSIVDRMGIIQGDFIKSTGDDKTFLGDGIISDGKTKNGIVYDSWQLIIDEKYSAEWLVILDKIIELNQGYIDIIIRDVDDTFAKKKYTPINTVEKLNSGAYIMYAIENEIVKNNTKSSREALNMKGVNPTEDWSKGNGLLGIQDLQFLDTFYKPYTTGGLNAQLQCWEQINGYIQGLIANKLNNIYDAITNWQCFVQTPYIGIVKNNGGSYYNYPLGGNNFNSTIEGLSALIFEYVKDYYMKHRGITWKKILDEHWDEIIIIVKNFYLNSYLPLTDGKIIDYTWASNADNGFNYLTQIYYFNLSTLPIWKFIQAFNSLKS